MEIAPRVPRPHTKARPSHVAVVLDLQGRAGAAVVPACPRCGAATDRETTTVVAGLAHGGTRRCSEGHCVRILLHGDPTVGTTLRWEAIPC